MEKDPRSLALPFTVMSQIEHPFEHTLRSLLTVLETLPFPHCLLGALALSVWAAPRATQDVDILIAVEKQGKEVLVEALGKAGFIYDEAWADENPMIKDWHWRFRQGVIPADLMLARDAQDREALRRRVRQTLGDQTLWIASAEDVILHKLKAGRAQDFVDVLSVIHHQGKTLDLSYLKQWAKSLGIQEELTYCFGPSGLHSS